MDKLRVREVVVVEGKYDQNALSQVMEGLILTTDGFGVFKDKERAALLRRLARERGVIILTDSDGAGLVIRNHLKGILPPEGVKMAYIPDRPGKERRKRTGSREGKLGVEGMDPATLRQALLNAGASVEEGAETAGDRPFTKTLLYEMGLAGTPDAARRRRALQQALDLPQRLSANALTEVLNALTTPAQVAALLETLDL